MKFSDISKLNLDGDFDLTMVNFAPYRGLVGNTTLSIDKEAMLSFNYMSVIKRCVDNSLYYFDDSLDLKSKEADDFIKLGAIDLLTGYFRKDVYFGNKMLYQTSEKISENAFSKSIMFPISSYSINVAETNTNLQMNNDLNMVLADIRFATLNFLSMFYETLNTTIPSDYDYVALTIFLNLICKDKDMYEKDGLDELNYRKILKELFSTMFVMNRVQSVDLGIIPNWFGDLMVDAKMKKTSDGSVSTLETLDLIDPEQLSKFCYLLRLALLDPRSTNSVAFMSYVKDLNDNNSSLLIRATTRLTTSAHFGNEFNLFDDERPIFSKTWDDFQKFLITEVNELYQSISQDICAEVKDDKDIKPRVYIGFLEFEKSESGAVKGDLNIPFFKNKTYICMFEPSYNRVWNGISSSVFKKVDEAVANKNELSTSLQMKSASSKLERDVNDTIRNVVLSDNLDKAITQQLLAFQKIQMIFDSVCELPVVGSYYQNSTPEMFFQDILSLASSDNRLVKSLMTAGGIISDYEKVQLLFKRDAETSFQALVKQYEMLSTNIDLIKKILTNPNGNRASLGTNAQEIAENIRALKRSLLEQYVLQNKIYFILQKMSAYSTIINNKAFPLPIHKRKTLGALPPAVVATVAASTAASLIFAMKGTLLLLIIFLSVLPIVYKYCMTAVAGGGSLSTGVALQRKDEILKKLEEARKLPDSDPNKKDLIAAYEKELEQASKIADYGLKSEIDKVSVTDLPGMLGSSIIKVAVAGLAVGISIKLLFMYKREKAKLEALQNVNKNVNQMTNKS